MLQNSTPTKADKLEHVYANRKKMASTAQSIQKLNS